jgi:Protein of unknown function (DUF2795)
MSNTPNPIQLQKHLSGVDYPAKRDDLINAARDQGADEETIKVLQKIPDQEYDGPNAVSKAVSGKS